MKSAVIVFPGSNCDRDMAVALEQITGQKPHMVWHKESSIPDVDLIAVPGGFSFGDYLRCGAIAANSPIMRAIVDQANRGTRVLGVCNGFQVLTESGLLPGVLMRNAKLKFVCKDVWLKCENRASNFTNAISKDAPIRIPVAHHDGNYFDTADNLKRLNDQNQVAFRYVDQNGEATAEANPNGSQENIAGVFNQAKNVLGLMPHPERLVDEALGGSDGRSVFQSLLNASAEAVA